LSLEAGKGRAGADSQTFRHTFESMGGWQLDANEVRWDEVQMGVCGFGVEVKSS
jgi:hypothetical protein